MMTVAFLQVFNQIKDWAYFDHKINNFPRFLKTEYSIAKILNLPFKFEYIVNCLVNKLKEPVGKVSHFF